MTRSISRNLGPGACGLVLLLGAFGLPPTACGGRSADPNAVSSGGSDSESVGCAGSSGGAGPCIEYYRCLRWSDMTNEPIFGQSGPEACPLFSEIRFTDAFRESFGACYWEPARQAALVPPPNVEPGDCCYGIAYIECR
jgi:hypothetical protein